MTEREVSSERVSEERVYLIRKGGAWYRPDSAGYTINAHEAGRYTLEEAEKITHPNGPNGPRDAMSYQHQDTVPALRSSVKTEAPDRTSFDAGWAAAKDYFTKGGLIRNAESRDAIEAPAAEGEVVIELKMTPIEDRLPTRDEMCGEQTILTYNDKVGTWDISFMEAGWGEFGAGFALGVTHWLDITNMWPGIIAQVASFTPSPAAPSEVTEEMVGALERIEADCRSTIERYARNGPSFTSPSGDEYEPTSYVIDKLNELADISRAALKGDRS